MSMVADSVVVGILVVNVALVVVVAVVLRRCGIESTDSHGHSGNCDCGSDENGAWWWWVWKVVVLMGWWYWKMFW